MTFIVLALPRSRSAWLSHFLSYPPKRCGHDIAVDCAGMQDFERYLAQLDGTVETGAMLGWRVIRYRMPEAKLAVVRRPVDEVMESFERLALPIMREEIEMRDELLQIVACQPGVLSLSFEDLNDEHEIRKLFIHCLGLPFDRVWWEDTRNINVQIDMPERIAKLKRNSLALDRFRHEILYASQLISGGHQCLRLN